jgi:hypothetical protein
MTGAQWRSLAIFAAATVAVSFVSPTAALLMAGTVFVAILLKAVASGGSRLLTGG